MQDRSSASHSVDLDVAQKGVDVDLSEEFSNVRLSNSDDQSRAAFAADKMLDELSHQEGHRPPPLDSTPPVDPSHRSSDINNNWNDHNIGESNGGGRTTYQYDQFFEEVSLDLPRQPSKNDHSFEQTSPSKLLKFMPRRATQDSRMSTDASGPFYSISDVLNDDPSTAAAAGRDPNSLDKSVTPRGARRNVYEADYVVKAGGTSINGIKRRSSLNLFSRSKNTLKPSPLETVISKTRPRMLPPKDPQEEKKHLQQHQAMMKKARQLEEKKQKESNRRKEEKDKKMMQAVHIWEDQILSNWEARRKDQRTHDLWLQGIPPRCRKRVWKLAIGNDLQITKDTFASCIRRVPFTSHSNGSFGMKNSGRYMRRGSDDDAFMSSREDLYKTDDDETSSQELYHLKRVRRTSSLNVLHEEQVNDINSDGHSLSDQEIPTQESTIEEHVDNRKALELENEAGVNHQELVTSDSQVHSNGHDDDDNLRVGSDIEDSDEENETFDENEMPSKELTYLNKVIDEDILRTLPSLCVFQPDGPLFISLRRVLHAYVGYQENMTYSRGASFLAGMLLLNMNTQDTFVALLNMIRKSSVLSALYDSDESKVRGYFKIFNIIFAENLPKLYLHFKTLSLTPDHYLPDWFMTLFSSIIPLDLSSRLWDIFLLDGDIILFKAALAVLKYLEPLLWGGSFGETVKILNMGFIGEERGEEAKAALAVSGHVTQGEQDQFFDEVLGRNGLQFDRIKFRELVSTHVTCAAPR